MQLYFEELLATELMATTTTLLVDQKLVEQESVMTIWITE